VDDPKSGRLEVRERFDFAVAARRVGVLERERA